MSFRPNRRTTSHLQHVLLLATGLLAVAVVTSALLAAELAPPIGPTATEETWQRLERYAPHVTGADHPGLPSLGQLHDIRVYEFTRQEEVFGWHLRMLKSGNMVGLQVPTATARGGNDFLDQVAAQEHSKHASGFRYGPKAPHNFNRRGFLKQVAERPGSIAQPLSPEPHPRRLPGWAASFPGPIDNLERVPRTALQESWVVSRLEPVSVLDRELPLVYITKNLWHMTELERMPTRPLTEFETRTLQALVRGEDLIVEARGNQIRMIGSLRAEKRCVGCHGGEVGRLLGAFSYDLQRPWLPRDAQNSPHGAVKSAGTAHAAAYSW